MPTVRLGSTSSLLAEPPVWLPVALVVPIFIALGLIAGRNPAMAVVLALGLVFVLVAVSDLAAGVALLVLVVFVESSPVLAVSAEKLSGLVLVLAWVIRISTQSSRQTRLLFTDYPGLSYVFVLFLGWVLLSSTWAENTANAFNQCTRFLLVAVLYVIVYTALKTRRQLMIVIGAFVAGTAYTAAYGLVKRPSLDTVDAGRLVSTIADPNYLAASLIAGIALAGAGIVAARGKPLLQFGAAGALPPSR
jgi:hypothetical protein